jgi:hypothetical protein
MLAAPVLRRNPTPSSHAGHGPAGMQVRERQSLRAFDGEDCQDMDYCKLE